MSNFRLQWQKTEIYRYPRSVARYTMIQHERDKGNPLNKHAYVLVSFRRFHKINKVGVYWPQSFSFRNDNRKFPAT